MRTLRFKTVFDTRQRKKAYMIYQILENDQGKRKYRKVTEIKKSVLAEHDFGNGESSDPDSLGIFTVQLRTKLNETLRAVTDFEKSNIKREKLASPVIPA